MIPTKENFFDWLSSAKAYPTGVKLLHIGEYFEYLNPKKSYCDKTMSKVTPTYNDWCKMYLESKKPILLLEWTNEWCKQNNYTLEPENYLGEYENDFIRGYCIMVAPNKKKIVKNELNWIRIQMEKDVVV